MKDGQKFFLGGLGGLAPIIMNLLVLDLAVLLTGLNPLTVVGYVIRVLVLFGVGGFVAWLHTSERNRVKVFEIGLGAPAFILAFLNAGHVAANLPSQSSALLSATAYAQVGEQIKKEDTRGNQKGAYTVKVEEESKLNEFLRGFLGTAKRPTGIVVAVEGKSTIAHKNQTAAVAIKLRDPVFPGNLIETGPGSMVRLLLFNNSLLTINENARLIVDAGQLSGNKKIELLRGGVLVNPEKMKTGEIEIRTPSAVIGTRG
jgi:FecR-like protein